MIHPPNNMLLTTQNALATIYCIKTLNTFLLVVLQRTHTFFLLNVFIEKLEHYLKF